MQKMEIMKIDCKSSCIGFHSVKNNICHLRERSSRCMLIYIVRRGYANVVAAPENFIERVSMHLAIESRDNSQKYTYDLELNIIISLGCAVTNSLNYCID